MDAVREEIAALAATLIAEEGLDYGSAKNRALSRVVGSYSPKQARELLPSNDEVLAAVKAYQAAYLSDEQPQRLQSLRKKALVLMELLSDFSPKVVGAIANGTAGEHSDIHLCCYADSAKELGIFLLNQGVLNEAISAAQNVHSKDAQETLALTWQGEHTVIVIEQRFRSASRRNTGGTAWDIRLNTEALRAQLAETQHA
jgi:hypothetical protein